MSHRPIIDAGPGLNFFAVNQENLLIQVLGPMSAPETVVDEIKGKSAQDERFRRAAPTMRKLMPRYLEVLSDDVTFELEAVVSRITQMPMAQRKQQAKNLG